MGVLVQFALRSLRKPLRTLRLRSEEQAETAKVAKANAKFRKEMRLIESNNANERVSVTFCNAAPAWVSTGGTLVGI